MMDSTYVIMFHPASTSDSFQHVYSRVMSILSFEYYSPPDIMLVADGFHLQSDTGINRASVVSKIALRGQ